MVQQIERELAVARAQVQNGGHDKETVVFVCERECMRVGALMSGRESALALKCKTVDMTWKWCVCVRERLYASECVDEWERDSARAQVQKCK